MTLKSVGASALRGRAHPGAQVYRFASLLLELYPKGKQAILEIHRLDGARLAQEAVPAEWLRGNLEVGVLDEKRKDQGWALWSADVSVQLLYFRGNGFQGHWKEEQPSEFSTTGWSTVSVGRGKNGRLQLVRSHESPGEETAEGRKMDVWNEFKEWSPSAGDFVALPNP